MNVWLKVIIAFQNPPVITVPLETVNSVGLSSNVNRMLASKSVPSLCSKPLPLSETTLPDTLNDCPATGFAVMVSTIKIVAALIVIVDKLALVDNKSLEPLNTILTEIKPSG